jgi:hypothetical protein
MASPVVYTFLLLCHATPDAGGSVMKTAQQTVHNDVMTHLVAFRKGMSSEEQAAYDERVFAIRIVMELLQLA